MNDSYEEVGGEVGDGALPADEFSDLQDQVGDGAEEQPGADGAPVNEDYGHDPGSDDSDDDSDDVEGEGVGEGDEPA